MTTTTKLLALPFTTVAFLMFVPALGFYFAGWAAVRTARYAWSRSRSASTSR